MSKFLDLIGAQRLVANMKNWTTARISEIEASGVPGPSNVLSIGTVETVASTDNAEATITGTSPNQTLNLKIPRGAVGQPGDDGVAATVVEVPAADWPPVDNPGVLYVRVP